MCGLAACIGTGSQATPGDAPLFALAADSDGAMMGTVAASVFGHCLGQRHPMHILFFSGVSCSGWHV